MRRKATQSTLRRRDVLPMVALAGCTWSAAPFAQDATLEIVVVTAQKREQSLQDVPIAVTALSAAALEMRGINDVHTMSGLTPNVQLDSASPFSGSNQVLSASIRGIGQDDFAMNLDPGVGVYVDGVYLARTIGANQNLMDVERVEVLRGPQGTLFGRNTIGGAISVVTRTPGTQFSAKAQLTVGSFDRRDISATADIPISETLLTSLTAASLDRQGYQQQIADPNAANYFLESFSNYNFPGVGTSSDLGGQDEQTVRGKALWLPADSVRVTLAGDWTHSDTSATPNTVLAMFDTQANGGGALVGLYNTCIQFSPATAPPGLDVICGPMGPQTTAVPGGFVTSGPSLLTGPRQPYTLAATQTGDIDKTYATGMNFDRLTSYGTALTVDWEVRDDLQFKSITGYRRLDWESATDLDTSVVNYWTGGFESGQHQFSQEVQAIGAALDARLNYVAGLYYFNERGFIHDYPILASGLFQIDGNNELETTSYAAFAHVDYQVTEKLGLTLGGRYSQEEKEFEGFQADPNGLTYKLAGLYPITPANQAALGFPAPGEPLRYFPPGMNQRDFSVFNPKVGVQYAITRDVLAYASWSEGFKSGGWTTRLSNPIPSVDLAQFGPEEAQSYEIGLKTEWLSGQLVVNWAGFFTDYTDIQLSFQQGISPTLKNAGDAEIKGMELDVQALVGGGLSLYATAGWMDAQYTRLALGTGLDSTNANPTALPLDAKLPKTPEFKFNLSPQYEVTLRNSATLRFLVDWTRTASMANDPYNTPELIRPETDQVGASIQFSTPDDKTTFIVGGTNLTNDRYITTGQNQQGGGFIYGTYNAPRQCYATARTKF